MADLFTCPRCSSIVRRVLPLPGVRGENYSILDGRGLCDACVAGIGPIGRAVPVRAGHLRFHVAEVAVAIVLLLGIGYALGRFG